MSDTCTERMAVDATGISGKVSAHYPGRSADLPAPRGSYANVAERRCDGSAEVSRWHSRPLDPVEGLNMLKQAGA